MIDIHTHVLPAVDDGAVSAEESLRMCRLAAADGCTVMIATPHVRHPSWPEQDVPHLHRQLTDLVGELNGEIELRLGAEIRVGSDLLEDLESADGGLLSLADSHYLLLELPRIEIGPRPEELLHEVLLAGWRPILAHPELIPYLADDIERVASLVDAGALLQVTAMSVTGDFGAPPRQWAWEMLRRDLVHFVASDTHSVDWRPPGLKAARRSIESELGERRARQLTVDHPSRILFDQELEPATQNGDG